MCPYKHASSGIQTWDLCLRFYLSLKLDVLDILATTASWLLQLLTTYLLASGRKCCRQRKCFQRGRSWCNGYGARFLIFAPSGHSSNRDFIYNFVFQSMPFDYVRSPSSKSVKWMTQKRILVLRDNNPSSPSLDTHSPFWGQWQMVGFKCLKPPQLAGP